MNMHVYIHSLGGNNETQNESRRAT